MEKKCTVLVLMSTYNGEKYLEEQIKSITNQKNVQVHILVRDDGSFDGTVNILKKYKNNASLKLIEGTNLGYEDSFFALMKSAFNSDIIYDYYAFSDQDDYWLLDKLYNAVSKMECYDEFKPKLYYSNLTIVDKDLRTIGIKNFSKISLGSEMVRHNLAGCTMVFNYSLLKLAIQNKPPFKISHDSWITKMNLLMNGISIYDEKPQIYYRQHGNNVTGVKQGILKRIKREFKGFKNSKNMQLKTVQYILQNLDVEKIPSEQYEILSSISKYKDKIINTIRFAFDKRIRFNKKIINLIHICKVLIRYY